MELTDRIRETLRPFAGSKLVVAVSGGVDSVTLLDLLLKVREELRLTLVVAHLDHGDLPFERKTAKLVRDLANSHSLPFVGERLDLSGDSNLEARARETRYRWLERVRKRRKADYIATAHQADDQVETLFLHLARGSGLQGLAGMQVVSGKILRPMLDIPRKQIVRYARREKLHYLNDPGNRKIRFARNRIRRQVITSLQKVNPQLVETVSQSMRIFSDQYDVIRILAGRELAQATRSTSGTDRVLDRRKLMKLDRPVRHLVWREALRSLLGDLRGATLRHLENLDELLTAQTGSLLHLPRGIRASRRYEEIVLRTGTPATPPKAVTLSVPGSIRFGDLTVSASPVTGRAPATGPRTIIVDAEAVGSELRVRRPRPADRFKPAGVRGSKLVSDLLTDAKVPRDERPWVPVLTTGRRTRTGRLGRFGDIVWVAGHRADRRFASRPGRPRVALRIT